MQYPDVQKRVCQSRIPQPSLISISLIKQEASNDVSLTTAGEAMLFCMLVVTVPGFESVLCEESSVTLFPNLLRSVEAVGTLQSAW